MKKDYVTERIYSKYSINDIRKRYLLLGIDNFKKTIHFLNFRLLTSIVIFLVLLYTNELGYILGPVFVILFYYFMPKLYFGIKVNKRKKILEHDAMFYFEVLSLAIESGNNLHNALLVTTNNIDNTLSKEFKIVINEVRYGKSLDEALEKMHYRIPSDIINNIILNIRESIMFGNNIIETLNNQVDYLREKKILEIKAVIAKIPMKISVISVVFFIPLLLLLILGPVLIGYLN